MTTAAQMLRLDRDHFLNDDAVKLAVKTYMIATDSYRDPLAGPARIDSAGIRDAERNMTMILRAYHLDGLVTTRQILRNLQLQELRNSDVPAIKAYYKRA